MCTHELWTYSECGCWIDHHVPCEGARYLEDSPARSLQFRQSPAQTNQFPVENQSLSSSNFDPAERMFRTCSVNRTVHRSFLEPICEDCLMEELDQSRNSEPKRQAHHLFPSTSLVWDSDVKIEVNHSKLSAYNRQPIVSQSILDAKILESNVEVRISDADAEDTSKTANNPFPTYKRASDHTLTPTTFSNGDADSESSVPDNSFRGRARSRTKQLRRMAMDVSREDIRLRVSSRLPSFQRCSLQNFKNELQREQETKTGTSTRASPNKTAIHPMRSLVQRFADAQEETWLKARDAVSELGRKLSRKSEIPTPAAIIPYTEAPKRQRILAVHGTPTSSLTNLEGRSHNSCHHPDGDNEHRRGSADRVLPGNFYLGRKDPGHQAKQQQRSSEAPDMREMTYLLPSWRDHLAADLIEIRGSKHSVAIGSPESCRVGILEKRGAVCTKDLLNKSSASSTTTAVSSRNSRVTNPWNQSDSYPHHSSGNVLVDKGKMIPHHPKVLQQRNLHISRQPLYPDTASDASSRIESGASQGRRLASLLGSDDFEHDGTYAHMNAKKDPGEQMAMAGLTENPWTKCRSISTMETLVDTSLKAVLQDRRKGISTSATGLSDSNGEEIPEEQHTSLTAVRGPRSNPGQSSRSSISSRASRMSTWQESTTPERVKSVSALSASQAFNLEFPPPSSEHRTREHSGATSSPPPSPASVVGLESFSNALAIHSLSTPFNHNSQPQSPVSHSIEAVLNTDDHHILHRPKEQTTKMQRQDYPHIPLEYSPPFKQPVQSSMRQPPRTTDHGRDYQVGTTPSDMHSDFASEVSQTNLFSCVWTRELCPGPIADRSTKDTGFFSLRNGLENECVDKVVAQSTGKSCTIQRCGRVIAQKVGSCQCQGIVKFASLDTDTHAAYMEEVPDLERCCRSVAPVVRYVVGRDVCEYCARS